MQAPQVLPLLPPPEQGQQASQCWVNAMHEEDIISRTDWQRCDALLLGQHCACCEYHSHQDPCPRKLACRKKGEA